MSWRTVDNYGPHTGAPPARILMPPVSVNRATLARSRTIVTDNAGPVSDTGWSDWGSVYVGLSWIDKTNYAARFGGSSWATIECKIETAAGIGRPWKLLWTKKIIDGTTSAVSYTAEESQLLLPGDALSILLDAPDGSYMQFGTGAALIIADAT